VTAIRTVKQEESIHLFN